MLCQHHFNLAEFDAEAAYLDLVVDAAKKFDGATGPVTRQVGRLEEARARVVTEGVRHKLFSCELWAVEVAASDAYAADVQFAGHADGHGVHQAVQNIYLRIGNRAAH